MQDLQPTEFDNIGHIVGSSTSKGDGVVGTQESIAMQHTTETNPVCNRSPKVSRFWTNWTFKNTWNDAISQLLRISVKSEEEKDHSLMTRYIRAKSEHSPRPSVVKEICYGMVLALATGSFGKCIIGMSRESEGVP
ncbi:PREDICTED: FAR1-RELATED SEQUENCE 5 [Prunus dulcis]|uniref:PREDICTED: FAR1-RELATED SEQUENCE 5 n=1 Tax=Prunus dulcis TaxID=3755 RepID=A0A5E4FY96_PRUDU|nr:PREDICTED: FAR1-RELATED SEQUENCE 5 [Prunus dulcis]